MCGDELAEFVARGGQRKAHFGQCVGDALRGGCRAFSLAVIRGVVAGADLGELFEPAELLGQLRRGGGAGGADVEHAQAKLLQHGVDAGNAGGQAGQGVAGFLAAGGEGGQLGVQGAGQLFAEAGKGLLQLGLDLLSREALGAELDGLGVAGDLLHGQAERDSVLLYLVANGGGGAGDGTCDVCTQGFGGGLVAAEQATLEELLGAAGEAGAAAEGAGDAGVLELAAEQGVFGAEEGQCAGDVGHGAGEGRAGPQRPACAGSGGAGQAGGQGAALHAGGEGAEGRAAEQAAGRRGKRRKVGRDAAGERTEDAGGTVDGAQGVAGGVGASGQAEAAPEGADDGVDGGLDDGAQHGAAGEALDVLPRALPALHEGVGEALADLVGGALPDGQGVFGGLVVGFTRGFGAQQAHQFAAGLDFVLDRDQRGGVVDLGGARLFETGDGDQFDGFGQRDVGVARAGDGFFLVFDGLHAGSDGLQALAAFFVLLAQPFGNLAFAFLAQLAHGVDVAHLLLGVLDVAFGRVGAALRGDQLLRFDLQAGQLGLGELAPGVFKAGGELDFELFGLGQLAAGFDPLVDGAALLFEFAREVGEGVRPALGAGELFADGLLDAGHLGRGDGGQAFTGTALVLGFDVAAVLLQRLVDFLGAGERHVVVFLVGLGGLDEFLRGLGHFGGARGLGILGGLAGFELGKLRALLVGGFDAGQETERKVFLAGAERGQLAAQFLDAIGCGLGPADAGGTSPELTPFLGGLAQQGVERAEGGLEFVGVLDAGCGVCVLRYGRGFGRPALLFQHADLLDDADGEVVDAFVELDAGGQRLARQVGEGLGGFVDRLHAFAFELDGGLRREL